MQTEDSVSHASSHWIPVVSSFWFEPPAEDPAALLAKFQRWYQGGDAMDAEIRRRFAPLIERALAGQLHAWKASPSGRLALILLLDQFTRNVFRGSARAYAGDEAALALALEVIDDGSYREYSLEHRLFVVMPLVHAEDLDTLTRASWLAHEMVLEAPERLRETWALGHERVQGYRSVIERFGPFPHRNAVLGRSSTADELAFTG